jgi:hypothetical protein
MRDQHLDIWNRLLQQPFSATGVGHGFLPHQASTAPMAPIFPALSTYFIECFVKAGSANGPEAWLTLLQTWVGVLETKSFIAPAATKQPGATMLEYRLEGPIAEARIPSAAIVAAFTEGYQRVATSLYGSHYKIDFWAVLTTLPLSVMASTGCAVADIMIDLCSAAGHLPKVSDQHRQESLWMRLQSTQTVAGAKGSKELHLTGRVPTDLLMDSQMLEEITVEFQRSRPAKVVQFLESLDQKNFAAVLYAMQLCQQHDCPVSMRQAIMFYMQTSTTNMYGDLKAWKNFQDGRFRRAHTILRTRQLKPIDPRLIALALGRPSSAGIRSPFSESHCVTLQVKKDSDMSLEQIYMGWTKESELIRQFGWAINQPCEDYHDIIQEFRMIYDELSSSQSTSKSPLAVVGRFRELITTLIDFRAELVGKYASEYVVLHAPYPSLYTCAHLRSNYEHEPYFRNFIDSVVTRTRKIVVEETNPVYKASPADSAQGVNFAKIVAQSNSALASLQKQVQSLTTAAAAGQVSTQQQQAALKASKTAAQALKAAAAAVPGSVVPPAKAKRGTPPTVSPPKQKGANPVPPSPAKKTAKQIKYDAAAALRLAQANGGGGGGAGSGTDAVKPGTQLIPVPRFKSTKLRTEEEGKKWDYPPWAYTSNGFSVPGSLVHDWFHDVTRNDGREHLCYYDVCGVGRGCGNPSKCFSFLDPSKNKEHPNGDNEDLRTASRTKWAEACAVDAAAGYLGYGTGN